MKLKFIHHLIILCLGFLIFSLAYARSPETSKVRKLNQLLLTQLTEDEFSVNPPNKNNNYVTTIELSPNLGEKYKKKLHLWVLESAALDKNFERVHVKMAGKDIQSNPIVLILISLFLLSILYLALYWISNRSENANLVELEKNQTKFDSKEEEVTYKVEQKIAKELFPKHKEVDL